MNTPINDILDAHYKKIGVNCFYRSLTAIYLFDFFDRLREYKFPNDWPIIMAKELKQLESNLGFFNKIFQFQGINPNLGEGDKDIKNVELKTARIYFDLWNGFNNNDFSEAFKLLKERFEKNSVSVNGIKAALDDGCGSGRYSFALKELGCSQVTGIDLSYESVGLAKSNNPFTAKEVRFIQGSVLALPFENDTFECVFSNGVLHHTVDPRSGLKEIHRVLKKSGFVWLYLYGGKGSLFWDIVDFCRKLVSDIPQAYTQSLMRILGYPTGRIFHRNDFFYVPINNRYYQSEVESMLGDAGFGRFRRLKRGVGYDWDEMIFNNPQIDPYIFGEGEMRYVAYKC